MKRKKSASMSAYGFGITAVMLVILNVAPGFINNSYANDKLGAKNPPVKINPTVKAINDAMVSVSDAVLPTVVSINVVAENKSSKSYNGDVPDEFRDFFKFFGDGGGSSDAPIEGSGSGVIVSENGYIATNNHVVENAKEITVITADKKKHKATLVGTDPSTDIALIKIDAEGLPVAHFADMEKIRVGEMVLAVGNPLGLNSTVTQGIVSAIGRGQLSLVRDKNGFSVENFIQTDAAINPGNSGGGLFDLNGSLVGINTAIATRTGSYIGYGFAIPIDLVKAVIDDLLDDGKISRGYIGVRIESVDEVTSKALGLDNVSGVLVQGVVDDSPAKKAGIEMGDVILELDGKPVKTSNELQSTVVKKKTGDKVELTVWRNGKKINKTVTLEPRDGDDNSKKDAITGDNSDQIDNSNQITFDKLGFTVENLTKKQKEDNDVEAGVVVSKVDRVSNAARRGLYIGSIIVEADMVAVSSPGDLKKKINSKKSGEAILLKVKYKDTSRLVALDIP